MTRAFSLGAREAPLDLGVAGQLGPHSESPSGEACLRCCSGELESSSHPHVRRLRCPVTRLRRIQCLCGQRYSRTESVCTCTVKNKCIEEKWVTPLRRQITGICRPVRYLCLLVARKGPSKPSAPCSTGEKGQKMFSLRKNRWLYFYF